MMTMRLRGFARGLRLRARAIGIAHSIRLRIRTILGARKALVAIARHRAIAIFHALRAHVTHRSTTLVAAGAASSSHAAAMSATGAASAASITAAPSTAAPSTAVTTGCERDRRDCQGDASRGDHSPALRFHTMPPCEYWWADCTSGGRRIHVALLRVVSICNAGHLRRSEDRFDLRPAR